MVIDNPKSETLERQDEFGEAPEAQQADDTDQARLLHRAEAAEPAPGGAGLGPGLGFGGPKRCGGGTTGPGRARRDGEAGIGEGAGLHDLDRNK